MFFRKNIFFTSEREDEEELVIKNKQLFCSIHLIE
jgi:hypothetical protein